MDDRTAEVTRVMHMLKLHAAEQARNKTTAAEAVEAPLDAYDVLGLAPDTPAGEDSGHASIAHLHCLDC
jgi:hypothetical protein